MDSHLHNDERTARIEALIALLDAHSGESATGIARELVALLLDLQGEAWARLLGMIDALERTSELRASMLDDPMVATMLMLHDVHPDRSAAALDGAPQPGTIVATVPVSSITVRTTGQRIAGAHV